ncbi:MAG: hypothetical protein HQM08_24375 [Candidatus Riflebacteria bacterium]|nr:hypothetical protein [Candidatus Riflebacteria bacterium]
MKEELERCCCNCNNSFPAEPVSSDYLICLNDPEFVPFIDDLLEKDDFSFCEELIRRKRFPVEQEACSNFDPVEPLDEFSESHVDIFRSIGLTLKDADSIEGGTSDAKEVNSKILIEEYFQSLCKADSLRKRERILKNLGFFILNRNKAAFDALCLYLRQLPAPQTSEESHYRSDILTNLTFTLEYNSEIAHLLVQDLFKVPSNNQTRSWYTDVWKFFERCSHELTAEALQPILNSPKFSYRIKQRVKAIINFGNRYQDF